MRKTVFVFLLVMLCTSFFCNYVQAGGNVTVLEQMPEDSMQWALIRAKTGVKRIAHDPGSISDLEPVSYLVKVKVKGMPACKYVMQVSYRGKNALGATVLNRATVMFDDEYNVLKISSLD